MHGTFLSPSVPSSCTWFKGSHSTRPHVGQLLSNEREAHVWGPDGEGRTTPLGPQDAAAARPRRGGRARRALRPVRLPRARPGPPGAGDEEAADRSPARSSATSGRHPDAYDPQQGPMRSWVARSPTGRRCSGCARRSPPRWPRGGDGTRTEELEQKVSGAASAAARRPTTSSPPCPHRCGPRWSSRTSSAGTTGRPRPTSGVTEDEARRRLRLGLQLLSTATTRPIDGSSPPGCGRAL